MVFRVMLKMSFRGAVSGASFAVSMVVKHMDPGTQFPGFRSCSVTHQLL